MNCMSNRDKEANQTNQVQTKRNIVKGHQTSVIHLILGSTCHWISDEMRYFFKNIFWSKHCPAITSCRSQLSRVFLVKPVLKISQISQKNIHSTCQVTGNFVLKSNFTGMFFSEIYEIFRTAILSYYTFFCFFITYFANFIYSSPNLWN